MHKTLKSSSFYCPFQCHCQVGLVAQYFRKTAQHHIKNVGLKLPFYKSFSSIVRQVYGTVLSMLSHARAGLPETEEDQQSASTQQGRDK